MYSNSTYRRRPSTNGQTDMVDNQRDNEHEMNKLTSLLVFLGVVAVLTFIGVCVKSCNDAPDNSIVCTKAGFQWIPEKYEVVNGYNHTVDAYCSLPKKE